MTDFTEKIVDFVTHLTPRDKMKNFRILIAHLQSLPYYNLEYQLFPPEIVNRVQVTSTE